nr:hypothetical protein [Tanacetum cinerariifolium]
MMRAERVQVLEDREGVAAKQSGDDAPIKGSSINEGEAAAEKISNDSEEIARVLTSMDAATVLAGGIDVPTGSGSIPTAGPPATVISTGSEVGPTASPTATRRKGKEVMIARDAEVARIHVEEELQGMIDSLDKSNETIAKYLQEYQDFASELPLEKRIELISDLVKYQDNYSKVEDFILMGSKEETKRLKRKGLNLEQEQVRKAKSSEEAHEIETSTEEFTEEKVKEMMQLVPVEDVYVQALQVKHPIIDWKGRIVGNKMHKAFLLLVRKFPLPEGTSHCLKMNATIKRIEMPLPEVCTAIKEKKKKLKFESFTHTNTHISPLLTPTLLSFTYHLYSLIMTSLFAESHNMVTILEKSDAAEGFEQIINFLSGSYTNQALTVNPHVFISCIKQFWNTAVVKRSGDVTRLQALVDKKRIMITEEVVREILQLNDAEGVVCLSNEEIFVGLA